MNHGNMSCIVVFFCFFLFIFYINNISFFKNGLDSRLKAYNKSSPCVSRVSNTKVR